MSELGFWSVMVMGWLHPRWERLGGSTGARETCIQFVSRLPGVRQVRLSLGADGVGDQGDGPILSPHAWAREWEQRTGGGRR